ncbi:PaaI family thioesterase [Aliiruegeria sabulilitoris]|uniref:PaaI family thioesterase n=1 Tax=Aliiruegeria sabulilitoris TaxID=1510458 RepID=UPI00082B9DC1|nr:PaaI family thioesterase [Aliiruegeria sabulilitoris]NDR55101.1 PaaI family thioesterase [Pseudoruegeria sp. M32A2M]
MDIVMQGADLESLIAEVFPQVANDFRVEAVTEDGIRLRLRVAEKHLRPGGTVSGPSIFALADCAMYMAVMSRIGPEALTVTTSCSIDFMRKPKAGRDLLCDLRLLKLGRSLAVGDCLITREGGSAPVARAALTYSIPPSG